jgi:hypothetical protein
MLTLRHKLEGFVMAHWWELWSPGLQAAGGVVELVGAGLLAYEWRISMSAIMKRIILDARVFTIKVIEEEVKAGGLNGLTLDKNAEEYKEAMAYKRGAMSMDAMRPAKNSLKLYKRGFILIVAGAILQIAANGIGWAGSYGIFGA